MKKLLVILSVILLPFLLLWASPLIVHAVSGIDNASAYSEALQTLLYSLQETLQRLVDNSLNTSGKIVDAMDKTQGRIITLFEKAIEP